MIRLSVPGFGTLELRHLVLDYNGTLAVDGRLIPGVRDALAALAERLAIHVITADTFGRAGVELAGLPVNLTIIAESAQDEAKLAHVVRLGPEGVFAIGNGRNDRRMLAAAAVGVAVVQAEGASAETVASADVVAASVLDALELLREPKRLIATLRA
ncbi:MAG TPA: HAD hydrolase family protein [Casimicrobiaceae bacterium]|nr:HAD hydrolase family protein [Casimicrobiaceae bacterium]